MRTSFFFLILTLTFLYPALAEEPRSLADQARLRLAQSNLINFGEALRMWANDHQQTYPSQLSVLTPNYLHHIMVGPSGSTADWDYRVSSDGRSYEIGLRGQPIAAFGLGKKELKFGAASGLSVPRGPKNPAMFYSLTLPAQHRPEWKDEYGGFARGQEFIYAALEGPHRLNQSGTACVQQCLQDFRDRGDVVIDSSQPFTSGELTGLEVKGHSPSFRRHAFYMTDGELTWSFDYTAAKQEFSETTDAMFVEMFHNRKRGVR